MPLLLLSFYILVPNIVWAYNIISAIVFIDISPLLVASDSFHISFKSSGVKFDPFLCVYYAINISFIFYRLIIALGI